MKKLMAANWKMYKTMQEASSEAEALSSILLAEFAQLSNKETVIFASATNLPALYSLRQSKTDKLSFDYGAQNFYPAQEGAYTGEISLDMIKATQANWVLVGHSERRAYFHEDNAFLAQKTEYALNNAFRVVFCIGETLEEREANNLRQVLEKQLKEGLAKLPANYKTEDLAIAYEPVWAIGTGKVASDADIEEAHAIVRELLTGIIAEKAQETRILYGGSVKPENAKTIVNIKNVDGVLVGGASLKADSFSKIVLS